MAVLREAEGPKSSTTGECVASSPSQAPNSSMVSPYLRLRALPCPTPLPGALLPPSTETGGLGP